MESRYIQKVCLMNIPSELLKNLWGRSYGAPKIVKNWILQLEAPISFNIAHTFQLPILTQSKPHAAQDGGGERF